MQTTDARLRCGCHEQGARAMQAGSVLETARVAGMLALLPAPERAKAVEGLELLAKAARRIPAKTWRRAP